MTMVMGSFVASVDKYNGVVTRRKSEATGFLARVGIRRGPYTLHIDAREAHGFYGPWVFNGAKSSFKVGDRVEVRVTTAPDGSMTTTCERVA